MSSDGAKVYLFRVFNHTVQRVLLSAKSLNKEAAFIFVDYAKREVLAWIGSACAKEDHLLAKELALIILRRDLNQEVENDEEAPFALEGEENEDELEMIVTVFNVTSVTFYGKAIAAEKKKVITNSTVSVGLLEAVSWASDVYDFKEFGTEKPDSVGAVARATFVPIEMETIAYMNIGAFWDVWVSRAVSPEDAAKVMKFVRNVAAAHLKESDAKFVASDEVLDRYVVMVRQGEEGTLFRRPLKIFTDFNPPGKCIPKPAKVEVAPVKAAVAIDMKELANSAAAMVAEKKTKGGVNFMQEEVAEEEKPSEPENFWSPTERPHDPMLYEPKVGKALPLPRVFSNGKMVEAPCPPAPSIEVVVLEADRSFKGLSDDFITKDMLVVAEGKNETPEARQLIIAEAGKNPASLIGYQVSTPNHFLLQSFPTLSITQSYICQPARSPINLRPPPCLSSSLPLLPLPASYVLSPIPYPLSLRWRSTWASARVCSW
jgi:hypothetical protein